MCGYLRSPFGREPDFDVTSVNYGLAKLLPRGDLRLPLSRALSLTRRAP